MELLDWSLLPPAEISPSECSRAMHFLDSDKMDHVWMSLAPSQVFIDLSTVGD